MKTDIAVVVPNWNGEDMLYDCLKSLRKQTLRAEIIVVDNGSEDGSIEMIKKNFPEVRLIKNFKNLGFAGGVNKGIEQALGVGLEYIALLNNDVVVHPNWLFELYKEIDRSEKCGIVASKVIEKSSGRIDNTGECISVWGFPFPRSRGKNDSHNDPSDGIIGASGGSTLYRASMLREIGLFDEDFFAYYEDADINLRAHLAGWQARHAKKAIVYHEIGGTSKKIHGFTTYQTFKNLPWVIVKNIPLGLMPRILPRFILLYSLSVLKALLSRHFFAVIKAVSVSFIYMPKKAAQRYKTQRCKKISARHMNSLLYEGLPPNSKLNKLFRRP